MTTNAAKVGRFIFFLLPIAIILVMSFFMGKDRAAAQYYRYTSLLRVIVLVVLVVGFAAYLIHTMYADRDDKNRPHAIGTDLIILAVLLIVVLLAIGWTYFVFYKVSNKTAARVEYLNIIGDTMNFGKQMGK